MAGVKLCINVQGRRDVGVAHKLLHHFDVFPIGFEQRGVRVTEGMEADPLRNPGPLRSRLEKSVQQRICPRRHSALNSFAGEDPVVRCGIADVLCRNKRIMDEARTSQRIGEFVVSFQSLENRIREIGWFILDPGRKESPEAPTRRD